MKQEAFCKNGLKFCWGEGEEGTILRQDQLCNLQSPVESENVRSPVKN